MIKEPYQNILIDDQQIACPVDIVQPDYIPLTKDLATFKTRGEIKQQKFITLHENAGSINRDMLYAWLQKKGYGYHIIIDPYGITTQHADLWSKLWHGGRMNNFGIGICLLNPYYPKLVDTMEEKRLYEIIQAEWWTHCSPRKVRLYARPTNAQLETLAKLVPFLCEWLGVPYVFPTENLNRQQRKIKNWLIPRTRPEPGVIAHRDYSRHADGRFALEHLIKERDAA